MTEISMMTEISTEIFSGINGASMGLFEIDFRIFISAIIISESAFDLGYLISQTEVYEDTGDKSGAEAPGPSGFPISFHEFTNVFISTFIKLFRIFLFRSS